MTFGPKRGHVLFIFENFFRDFGLLLIAISVGLIRGDMELIYENLGILAITLIGPVGRIMQYCFTRYSVDEERLLVESGWLRKQRLEVPLATITTVDLSQNILHQLFGAYRLNVDNASNVIEGKTRVRMTFGREDAFAVRELLIAGRRGLDGFNLADEMPEPAAEGRTVSMKTVNVRVTELLLWGALKSKGMFLVELIGVVSTAGALFNLSDELLGKETGRLLGEWGLLKLLLALMASVFLLAVVCGMVGTLIRYYGFHVADNGQAVKIEYGLLTKKRYTIQKNRISGFSYEQSFFLRLFHLGTLQLFAIGYGGAGDEESREEPILFPLIKEGKVRAAISEMLEDMEERRDYHRAPKGSLRYFFYGVGFAVALGAASVTLWFSVTEPFCRGLWVVGLLILSYSVCGRSLEYRHAAMYAGERNFSMTSGGFKTNTVFVKTSHMESVEAKASVWKLRKGILTVNAGYIAPLTSAHMVVKNVPKAAFEEARERLIY